MVAVEDPATGDSTMFVLAPVGLVVMAPAPLGNEIEELGALGGGLWFTASEYVICVIGGVFKPELAR